MPHKVIVIGSLNYDIIYKISHQHVLGETLSAQEVSISGGGKGANQATQCAKLGLETYMVGCIGKDATGDYLLANMKSFGVKTDFIRRCDEISGIAAVNALSDGSVYSTIGQGANYAITTQDIDNLDALMQDCDAVLLQLEIPLSIIVYAAQKAHDYGCKVILNAAPAIDIPQKLFENTDVFIVNEVEAEFYLKQPIDDINIAEKFALQLASENNKIVVFTLGGNGSVVSDGQIARHISPVSNYVVETTGAGDSFVGAIAYFLAEKKEDIYEASMFASYCSAITIANVGAQQSMPTLDQVLEYIAECKKNN